MGAHEPRPGNPCVHGLGTPRHCGVTTTKFYTPPLVWLCVEHALAWKRTEPRLRAVS